MVVCCGWVCVLRGVVPVGVVLLGGVSCVVLRTSGKAPVNSAALLLGDCSSSQPEPEITEPSLQV